MVCRAGEECFSRNIGQNLSLGRDEASIKKKKKTTILDKESQL